MTREEYKACSTNQLFEYLRERCEDVRVNLLLDLVVIEMKVKRYRYLMRAHGANLREALLDANVERSKLGSGEPM